MNRGVEVRGLNVARSGADNGCRLRYWLNWTFVQQKLAVDWRTFSKCREGGLGGLGGMASR